ncbi:DNA polymerase [Pseudovibrio ascidiaceicola]|uniref:DNA polymerase n=1 Tax=Pseudovibrio ascidiaceicola TaxID=285279 RepID=UPI003D3669D4
MRLAFDIETDGLLEQLTVIHSLVLYDIDSGKGWSCTDHTDYVSPNGYTVISIDEGIRMLMEADVICGHNIIKFDIPAVKKVKPWFDVKREAVVDTLIISRLVWPEIRENDFNLRRKFNGRVRIETEKTIRERTVTWAETENAYEEAKSAYMAERREWRKTVKDWNEFIDGPAPEPPVKPEKPKPPVIEQQAVFKEEMNKFFPGRLIGSHGLEAWGYRLGEWKGDYSAEMKAKGLDPWAEWNVDMQEYCEQDVIVTEKLWIFQESKGYSEEAVVIERDFAWIIAEMERNGFPFDMPKAVKLQQKLMRRQAELYAKLQEAFPPIKDKWQFIPKANNARLGYVKGEPIERSEEIIFNPASRDHIARWLKKKHGWKPAEYTEHGKPKIDEAVLKKLPFPEAALLSEYFLLDKRLGMLEGKGGRGLIPAAKKGGGHIHGTVTTNGAVTRRCTHSSPNMAQIPAVNVPYGHDFRSLLHAPDDWVLLGWDASGLELRCFAHYMALYDGGLYTSTILSGDIHWQHAKALELVGQEEEYDEHNEHHNFARNKVAKRFIYAYLYGAGPETIGAIVMPEGSPKQQTTAGRKLTTAFLRRTPALKRLKEDLKKSVVARKNHVKGIDGGILKVRSHHSALNTLLQSAGAIAVKLATIIFYDKLIAMGLRNGVDFMLVAHVHDEVQALVKKGKEDVVGKAAVEAMREAGDALGFKCPLDGEFKVGLNWAETH